MNFIALANKGLQTLQPYQPGKPISELEREQDLSHIIKLASNENPLGCSPLAKQAAINAIDAIARYPDGASFELKHALAQHLSIPTHCLTLGAGSEQLISLLIQSFVKPDHEVISSQYAFSIYAIASFANHAQPILTPAQHWGYDVDEILNHIRHKTSMIFIANPNNPTGTYINTQSLKYLLEKVPEHILCVLDEAYFEYVKHDDYPDTLALQKLHPNLITLRTFSKAYGLAGLRVGYCIAHPDISSILNRARLTFNLNSPAQAAACAALTDQEFIDQSVQLNTEGMRYLVEKINELELQYIPSIANFLTIDLAQDSTSVYNALLEQGIIVRPLHPYNMPSFIRVSIGTTEENSAFINALTNILHKNRKTV